MATVEAPRHAASSEGRTPPLPVRSSEARHQLLLTLTDGTSQRIDELSRQTGYDKGELIDVAMTLFQLALQAIDEGKPVGVATPGQELELEFVGLRKDDPADS